MFTTDFRKLGQCSFCNSKEEVVPLDKGNGVMDYCKKHLWDALRQPSEKKPNGKAKKVKVQ